MRSIPVISLLLVLVVSCSKDKFETKPRLEIVKYETKEVFPGGSVNIDLKYFDKQGDLGGATFTAIRVRENQFPPNQDKPDTLIYNLPEFPDKQDATINFLYSHSFLQESLVENDTLYFRFSVVDNAGNQSDTVLSDRIVLHFE